MRRCNRDGCDRKSTYKINGKRWCCLRCELSGNHTYSCDNANKKK
jgi:hypothetical protein